MANTITMTREELVHIPSVEFTKTWAPVHHYDVVKAMDASLDALGVDVVHERYQVSADGMDLFAHWTLPADAKHEIKDSPAIGFRNSMKKRFSLGLVAGHKVMVCSNMAFFGEYVEHRRHTSGLTPEALRSFVDMAAASVLEGGDKARAWFNSLADYHLPETSRRLMIYEAIDQGIIAPNKWGALQEAYAEELKDCPAGSESLMHFHGSITRILREAGVGPMIDRSRKLNALCKAWGADDVPLLRAA